MVDGASSDQLTAANRAQKLSKLTFSKNLAPLNVSWIRIRAAQTVIIMAYLVTVGPSRHAHRPVLGAQRMLSSGS